MAMESLILVANPGSASRKYALYRDGVQVVRLHIEYVGSALIAHVTTDKHEQSIPLKSNDLHDCVTELIDLLHSTGGLTEGSAIRAIAIRIVAPSPDFLHDQVLNEYEISRLEQLYDIAPLHIGATLNEIRQLKLHIPDVPIVGISDSAFHITKPDFAWNYGISLEDADEFQVKRFGYHGISLSSVVSTVKNSKYGLSGKMIICHLGSGASVTALQDGKSVDTSMGYSPLEGLMMSTRSGTMEFLAGLSLARQKNISADKLAEDLNNKSGLLGISGSSDDIRELVEKELQGDYRAGLALRMYVYKIQQAIGQMAASLQGVDTLVFTGTVGQRSFAIRERVLAGLDFLGVAFDRNLNNSCLISSGSTLISNEEMKKHVYVVATDEESVMVSRAQSLI